MPIIPAKKRDLEVAALLLAIIAQHKTGSMVSIPTLIKEYEEVLKALKESGLAD